MFEYLKYTKQQPGLSRLQTRIESLKMRQLPELGALWKGDDVQFVEFLHKEIELMPSPVKDAMTRYYIKGEGQRKNEETGKVVTEDNKLWNLLVAGRYILATRLKEAQSNKSVTRLLERIYGF